LLGRFVSCLQDSLLLQLVLIAAPIDTLGPAMRSRLSILGLAINGSEAKERKSCWAFTRLFGLWEQRNRAAEDKPGYKQPNNYII